MCITAAVLGGSGAIAAIFNKEPENGETNGEVALNDALSEEGLPVVALPRESQVEVEAAVEAAAPSSRATAAEPLLAAPAEPPGGPAAA